MLKFEPEIAIDDIIGHSEYEAHRFCQERSSNHLIQICIGDSKYILKIYRNNNYFEKESYFMYLLKKNKCKAPRLVKYSSTDSPQPWILYEYVEGISLNQIKKQLSTKELKHIWKQVGQELKKIHSISEVDQSEAESLKSGFMCNLGKTVATFNNYLDKNEISTFLTDSILFLKSNFYRIERSVCGVILYDFNDKHIILRKKKEKWLLKSFIDFEQAHYGCRYIDVAWLYFNTLLDDQELEKSFWLGYDPEQAIFDAYCIYYFLLYFGLQYCTVLRKVNACHYQLGLSIIEKALYRIQQLN